MKTLSFCLLLLLSSASLWAQVPNRAKDVKPIEVGQMLPDAMVLDIKGETQSVQSLVLGKKTALIIYRGGWCPYCNLHLSDVAKIEPTLLDLGYQVLAISPDSPERLNRTVDEDDLNYRLFSDSKLEFIEKLQLLYSVDEASMKKILHDASEGKNEGLLPVPAFLLIDETGKIRFFHHNPNFKKRIKKAQILEAIDALEKG